MVTPKPTKEQQEVQLLKKLKTASIGVIDGSSMILQLHDLIKAVFMDLAEDSDHDRAFRRLVTLYDCFIAKQTQELEELCGSANDVFDAIRALEKLRQGKL